MHVSEARKDNAGELYGPAWVPMITLLTRAIMAKMAESAITVVSTPAWASRAASCWPSYHGARSATMTWNVRVLAARRKRSTVRELPMVRTISLQGA